MKRLSILLISSTFLFAQDLSNMRLLEGINQVQRIIELAKRGEVDKKNPYHFEKARASRDVASLLASDMDEVGSRLFMVKSFNSLSKAGSGKLDLDDIQFITQLNTEMVEYQRSLGIDIDSLNSALRYARENKALSCAPAELARGEVYYDAMAYELSKPRPSLKRAVNFYEKAQIELKNAIQKVDIAKEGNLECYTGKPFVPELAKAEEPAKEPLPTPTQTSEEPAKEPLPTPTQTSEEPAKEPLPTPTQTSEEPAKEPLPTPTQTSEEPAKEPTPTPTQTSEEPFMVTARVHFDFNKSYIKKEYIPLLNEVVKVLRENPNVRVRIEGFTDDIGSKAYNDRIALRRAQAVRDYLIKAGIPADRIEVAGFGKERYIADNTTPIGRFTNRRAEFIVIQVPGQ